jgi:hypothetical protein
MTHIQEVIGEKIIKLFRDNNKTALSKSWIENQINADLTDYRLALREMINMKLIVAGEDVGFNSDELILEPLGQKFTSFGDYNERIEKRAKIEERKERVDLVTKEYFYKTRYLPHVIAVVTLIITVYSKACESDKNRQLPTSEQQPKPQSTMPISLRHD